MTDKIIAFSACGSEEEAVRIARALVESRAAACVNIVPGLRSIYRWKGAVEDASEWLLLIKTTPGTLRPAARRVPLAALLRSTGTGGDPHRRWSRTLLELDLRVGRVIHAKT